MFLIVIIVILLIVGYIFISIKMNNLRYRAEQHVLKDTGISSSNINSGISKGLEKKYLEKLLEENSNFTEESLKALLKEYVNNIINRESINEFSQAVCEKIEKDSKINKIKDMSFKRVNINYYGNSKLNAIVVYTDNRDEYNIFLRCTISDEKIKLDKYQISRGVVVGF